MSIPLAAGGGLQSLEGNDNDGMIVGGMHDFPAKLRHYARQDVSEFWIEDVKHNLLHVYRNPVGDDFETCLTLGPDETVAPLAFHGIVFKVKDLLG